ncbi:MAG: alpha/beta hydrolase [Candidatus Ornithospirochaeta sp.]
MIVLIIVLVVAAFILILTRAIYSLVFYSPLEGEDDPHRIPNNVQYAEFSDRTHALIDSLMEKKYESVEIISHDGLKLFGRWYRGEEGKPTAILMHGYRGNAYRDFCGGCTIPMEEGWNVLLPDQRGHGGSEGHTISFGVNEKYDLCDWVEYVEKRTGGRIYLFGISMGGATVLMASSLLDNRRIKGIVADCPYSSPIGIIEKVCRDRRLPPSLSVPLIRLSARIWGRFSLKCQSAAEAVSHTDVPILIIHGLDDRFVPAYMSEEVEKANERVVRRETFDDAGHGLSYMVDTPRYKEVVLSFFRSLGEEV